jgi:hypothetical protein
MAAQAEVVNGHLAGLLLAMLAVLRRRLVLRVHDGSRRLGCWMLQGLFFSSSTLEKQFTVDGRRSRFAPMTSRLSQFLPASSMHRVLTTAGWIHHLDC